MNFSVSVLCIHRYFVARIDFVLHLKTSELNCVNLSLESQSWGKNYFSCYFLNCYLVSAKIKEMFHWNFINKRRMIFSFTVTIF
jgi:hypothetical protein